MPSNLTPENAHKDLEKLISDEDRATAQGLLPELERIAELAEQFLWQHSELIASGKVVTQSAHVPKLYISRHSFLEAEDDGLPKAQELDSGFRELSDGIAKLYRMYGRDRLDLPLPLQLHATVSARNVTAFFMFGIPE